MYPTIPPTQLCSFVLRRTNETELADDLDTPINGMKRIYITQIHKFPDSKSPDDKSGEKINKYMKFIEDKKCPSLPINYMTAVKFSKIKIKEFITDVRNYTISPCMSIANKTVHDELDRLKSGDKKKG
jgi:hypothetical protein